MPPLPCLFPLETAPPPAFPHHAAAAVGGGRKTCEPDFHPKFPDFLMPGIDILYSPAIYKHLSSDICNITNIYSIHIMYQYNKLSNASR
jgi:hypothetical protein